jgi:hypothetical protein
MQTLYRLNTPSELDEDFIRSLQLLFKDRPIEIMVKDIRDTESKLTFWDAIEQFREKADFAVIGEDDLFDDMRSTEVGREVDLS